MNDDINTATHDAIERMTRQGRDTRAETEELAKRLGLNPRYVESVTYIQDGNDRRVSVEMRNFELTLDPRFDIDDDRHCLPHVGVDMSKETRDYCRCSAQATSDDENGIPVWHICAACAVTIEYDE